MDIIKKASKKELYSLLMDKNLELINADFKIMYDMQRELLNEIDIILDADYNKITLITIENAIHKINNCIKLFAN